MVLNDPTLVLNRSWMPIRTTPVRAALCLLCRGAAVAVEPETYRTYDFASWTELRAEEDRPHVRTVRLVIRVPEVIVLTRYDRLPDQEVVFSRRNIFRRDRYACQYCGARPGSEELTIDHVVPRAHGGRSTWTNCVLACVSCNARKANRTPEAARMSLRRPPAKPRWRPILSFKLGAIPVSWRDFLSEAYWNVPLEE